MPAGRNAGLRGVRPLPLPRAIRKAAAPAMRHTIALPLVSDILVAHPAPKYDRRLSDKILAAFAHAYEVGERGVAARLRRALEEAEQNAAAAHPERRASNALLQADLLIEFVDAREAYKRTAERDPDDIEEIDRASREMLDAYRRWSNS